MAPSTEFRLFLASTVYDQTDLRAELIAFLQRESKHGEFKLTFFENPDTFSLRGGLHSHDVCLDAVCASSMLLLVIGSRYGGIYSGTLYPSFKKKKVSIVHAEVLLAVRHRLGLLTCVRQQVFDEWATYKANLAAGREIHLQFVRDTRVFELINTVQHLKMNNWIVQFRDVVDLKNQLKPILNSFLPPLSRSAPAAQVKTAKRPIQRPVLASACQPEPQTVWRVGPVTIAHRILLGGEMYGDRPGAYLREFDQESLVCRPSAECPDAPGDVQRLGKKHLNTVQHSANTSHQDFFNGGCFRLHNYYYQTTNVDSEDYQMVLEIGPTDFFGFLATNCAVDLPLPGGETIRRRYRAELQDFTPENFLSNRITVLLNVFLGDGRLVFVKRSRSVFLRPAVYQTSVAGGMKRILHAPQLAGDVNERGVPSPFMTAMRECKAELNIDVSPEMIKFLALGQDIEWLAPILIAEARLSISESDLWSHSPLSREKSEIREIHLTEFTLNSIHALLTSRSFASDSVVAILLSLMHRYSTEAVFERFAGTSRT
jgi:hypothetical protein